MSSSEYNMMLPANIVRLITARGLKNGAVAEKAGFTKQQFSDMLNGRRLIKPCDIIAISEALGVDVHVLFEPIPDSA